MCLMPLKIKFRPFGVLGLFLLVFANVWIIAETIYFGGNFLPGSDAEYVADSVGIFLLAGGFLSIALAVKAGANSARAGKAI